MAPEQPQPDPVSLEQAILGGEPVHSAFEVAAETGLSIEELRRLWRALGFPEHGTEIAFNPADTDAVATMQAIVESGAIDFDIGVMLTRGVGQTMARLADWEVGTLVHRVEELEKSEQATGSRAQTARRLIEEVNPSFERLLVYAWRRHLAAAVARMEALGASESDLHTTQLTVGFADIVAFTALSNEVSRERIGDIVEIFETRCADVVAAHRGQQPCPLVDARAYLS